PSAECCVNLILVFVVHNAWVCVLLSCNFMVTGYIRAECHLLRYLSVAPCLSHTHAHTHTHTHTHPLCLVVSLASNVWCLGTIERRATSFSLSAPLPVSHTHTRTHTHTHTHTFS